MARLVRGARKNLDGLPAPLRAKAVALIKRLDAEPALGKKLLGALEGLRSARLGRTHRVIYQNSDKGPIVLAILPRKDAYK